MEEKGLSAGFLVIAAIVVLLVVGSMNSSENIGENNSSNETAPEKAITLSTDLNKITMTLSANDLKYKNYQNVVNDLRKLGFTNIKTEAAYDIFFGILLSEGESDKISIDGNSDFKKGDTFSKDAEIIVTFHLSYTDDPAYTGTATDSKAYSQSTTESKTLFYSTNDFETAKKGNSGVYSYKSKGGQYNIYCIVDFDEGYVYRFRNDEGTCDRLKIDSGDLNNVLIITYHDGDDSWSNGLHFKWQRQPDHLILEDNNHFETDFYSTNLDDALSLRDEKKILDY